MCSGVPRFESNGAFAGYIASCVDLTDIKSAQEEASERQNLESLGVLAGGIAHDFNNLLGGTLSYSELAQLKLDEGNSPEEELRQIREVAIRGCEIVRQLMIFAGKERGTPEPLDVSSLVSEMLDLLKVSISKHATLKTSLNQGSARGARKSGTNPSGCHEPGDQRLGGDWRSRRSDSSCHRMCQGEPRLLICQKPRVWRRETTCGWRFQTTDPG